MNLETQRLILREWQESDAEQLFVYASDPRVADNAGFKPHESEENSLEIIRTILSVPENYALFHRKRGYIIGSMGLMIGNASNLKLADNEAELGYWLGVPFWGQGLVPEAAKEVLRHAFEDLKLEMVWAGYFDGNDNSKRVLEKCGFVYHHTNENIYWERINKNVTEHIFCLTKEVWEETNKAC